MLTRRQFAKAGLALVAVACAPVALFSEPQGLTVAKLREARRRLMAAEEPLEIVVTDEEFLRAYKANVQELLRQPHSRLMALGGGS